LLETTNDILLTVDIGKIISGTTHNIQFITMFVYLGSNSMYKQK